MKNRVSGFFLTNVLLLLGCFSVSAQISEGTLKGTVTDQTKSVIPEAKIILQSANGFLKETFANAEGRFSFVEIPLGKYFLTIEKEGFAVAKREINLSSAEQEAETTLANAEVSETVNIILESREAAVESTLKLPVSIHETPRSVSVIGSKRIAEQNFRQVPEILNYVAGTAPNSYRTGGYHFYARGYRMLPEDTRVDGLPGINVGGGFGASTFGVEEVVVLKGPAGLQYGSSNAPGGFVNLISKKPQENYFTRLSLRTGGYSGNGVSLAERPAFGADLDSTGKVFGNDRVLYRVLGTIENTNYFTKDTLDRNRYFNGSSAFKLDREGRFLLTTTFQYMRSFRPYGGGIVVSPTTSLRLNDGADKINTEDLSPSDVNLWNGRRVDRTGWGALNFQGAITEKVRVNAIYRYISFDTDINVFTPQVSTNAQIAALQNQNLVSRVQSKSLTERAYNNFSADAVYDRKNSGWWKNMTQIGFYERIADTRATIASGIVPGAQSPINIYTGQILSPLADSYPPITFAGTERDIVLNGFVQNRTSLADNRVNITLGVNYGQNKPAVGATRKSGFIPNAAIVFNIRPEFSVYASYATSFNPTDPDAENAAGERGTFSPTLGKNYEVGTKYDLLDRRLNFALALFQNQVDNALVLSDTNVLNPRGNRFYTAAGTRRVRGIEMTGEFQIRQDLRISVGAAYLDAVYKGIPGSIATSSSPILNSRAEKTPRWSYNLYTRYDRAEGYLKGFGAGLGIVWQGERLGSNGARTFAAPDPLILPAFTKVDSAIFYRLNKHVDFGLNVENLFDEKIFVGASVGSSMEIAAPRTLTLRTTFNF